MFYTGDNHTIRRHNCVSHGKYMLSVAGIASLTRSPDNYMCRELVKVLDTTTGKWLKETEQVEASAAFRVPESIIAEIGGE